MSNIPSINIAGRRIATDAAPYIIAELSANHNGNFDTALEIIKQAKAAGGLVRVVEGEGDEDGKRAIGYVIEKNKGLAPGRYRSLHGYAVSAFKNGAIFHRIPINIDLTVHQATDVEIPPNYESEGLAIPEGDPKSSLYYVFEDGNIGPSGSKWWGDDSGNLLAVPVVDQNTGDATVLALRAHKIACGTWWEINTGQSAEWGCTHKVHLQLEEGANDALVSGHTYSSPGSHPVVIKGIRWHQPNAVFLRLDLRGHADEHGMPPRCQPRSLASIDYARESLVRVDNS